MSSFVSMYSLSLYSEMIADKVRVDAYTRALQSVALELLQDHLGHCVQQAIAAGGPEADAKVAEASVAIARLVKS